MERNYKDLGDIKLEVKSLQREIKYEIERIHESMQEFEEMLDSFHEYFWEKSKEIIEYVEEVEAEFCSGESESIPVWGDVLKRAVERRAK